MDAVRARYGLKRPFALFVGTIEPRKNIDMLLDGYEALPASVREEFELVVAGPMGWASAETAARVRSVRGVRYLGYIPEPDIAPLTAAATVFAYPSLYEGFGFPVAQAMAAGTPVITSNVSSLPEITGDAALLIDPRSVGELRDGLNRLLLSATLRAELAARGRERARAFGWEACAARSLGLVGGGGGGWGGGGGRRGGGGGGAGGQGVHEGPGGGAGTGFPGPGKEASRVTHLFVSGIHNHEVLSRSFSMG
jgi:alpha-1,3-rhamnosyl/mannosyltransferase